MSLRSNGYRDMKKWRVQRERQKTKYRLRNGAFKWKRRWTKEEIRKVLEHSIPDVELSKEIKHSVTAIQKKRWEYKNGIDNKE